MASVSLHTNLQLFRLERTGTPKNKIQDEGKKEECINERINEGKNSAMNMGASAMAKSAAPNKKRPNMWSHNHPHATTIALRSSLNPRGRLAAELDPPSPLLQPRIPLGAANTGKEGAACRGSMHDRHRCRITTAARFSETKTMADTTDVPQWKPTPA